MSVADGIVLASVGVGLFFALRCCWSKRRSGGCCGCDACDAASCPVKHLKRKGIVHD